MKSLALIMTAACLVAAPLAAQQDTSHARRPAARPRAGMRRPGMAGGGNEEMMAMMREMMAPMMRVMAYMPGSLLAHKDSLNLTADQVSKLTALQTANRAAHDAAQSDIKTHLDELTEAFQTAAPDTNALRPHFEAAQAAMAKAHWAGLTNAAQSRALLTDAQRQKVDAAVAAMMRREHM
ncbi:MAG TPA: Spy/CpxP family protein refolding chaperone [Gemmatimonadales bacterium]|nr:Spy/CpxP family protein refolding chaperone [Gemmatimonadales bacterium]